MTPGADDPARPDEETEAPPEEQAPQGLEPEPGSPSEGPAAEASPAHDATDADAGDAPAAPVLAAAGGDSPPSEAVAPGAADDPSVRPDPKDVDLKLPLLILFGPVVIAALGSILAPRVFWDGFVYKYYWEPIVTDAGFTLVNTFTWALLMGAIIFLLWRVVQKIDQPVDFMLVAATLPYIVGGSISRVLEDTGFFIAPLRFFFITPIIYVLIVGVAVIWIVIGHLLKRHADEVGPLNAVKALAAFFGVLFVAFTVWSLYGEALADFGSPYVLFVALLVPLVYFWNHTKATGRFSQVGVMATFGMAFLLYMIYYVVLWHTGHQWDQIALDKGPRRSSDDLRAWIYLAMVAFPAVFLGAVYGIARWRFGRSGSATALAYLAPINLLLVFAQMTDATMTSLGVDVYGYHEKHVVPGFLIGAVQQSGTFLAPYATTVVMLPIKLGVALLVVWAIDIYAREDVKRYPDLVGLAKLAIIMVGLAPGVRNAVRLAMDI